MPGVAWGGGDVGQQPCVRVPAPTPKSVAQGKSWNPAAVASCAISHWLPMAPAAPPIPSRMVSHIHICIALLIFIFSSSAMTTPFLNNIFKTHYLYFK
jgi:hypothetical protein